MPQLKNPNTLQRYIELEKQMEVYEEMDLWKNIKSMINRASKLESSIKQQVEKIEENKNDLENCRGKDGPDSEAVISLEIDFESQCMELADDQHEYDTCMKYIRRGTASLFESNILAEEFHEILSAMFGELGDSAFESQLEAQIQEAEAAVVRHTQSFIKEDKICEEVKEITAMMLKALNTWGSLEQGGSTESRRVFLAKQTCSYNRQISNDLLVLEAKLKEYDDFKPDIECHKMLADLNSRIFQMYTTKETVDEGMNIIMQCRERTRRLEQWVHEKFKIKALQKTSKSLKDMVIKVKLKSKQERRNAIEDWLTEYTAELKSEDTKEESIVSDDQTVIEKEHIMVTEEFNIQETYEDIASQVKAREKQSELEGLRAGLDLQDKLRSRRMRQRHKRAQDLITARTG